MMTQCDPANCSHRGSASVLRAAAHDKEKLREIVCWLKQMDSILHWGNDPRPPTFEELRLYGLILKHVNSYLLLFMMEDGVERREMLRKELFEESGTGSKSPTKVVPPLTDGSTQSSGVGSISCSAIESAAWSLAHLLVRCIYSVKEMHASGKTTTGKQETASVSDFVCDSRAMDCKRRRLQVSEKRKINKERQMNDHGGKLGLSVEEQIEEEKVREEKLKNILRELVGMGHLRFYAPPRDEEEVCYYREIRKLVISSLSFVEAKAELQKIYKQFENVDEKWVPSYVSDYFGCDFTPARQFLASSFHSLPELDSILRDCISWFSDICSSIHNTDADILRMGVFRYVDKVIMEGDSGGNNQDANGDDGDGGHDEKMTNLPSGSTVVSEYDSEFGKKTRIQYLIDIMDLCKKIDLKSESTVEELRLCMRIMAHIDSSTWTSLAEMNKNRLHLQQGNDDQSYYILTKADITNDDGSILPVPKDIVTEINAAEDNMVSLDGKAREEYLKEIVLLVDAIDLLFMNIPPTKLEVLYYNKMYAKMCIVFKVVTGNRDKKQDEQKAHERLAPHLDVDVLKQWLKGVFEVENGISEFLEREVGEMVKNIIPGLHALDAVDALKRVDDAYGKGSLNGEIMELKELVCQSLHGLEMLDRATLIVEKIHCLLSEFFRHLAGTNQGINGLMYKEKYETLVAEICGAADILNLVASYF